MGFFRITCFAVFAAMAGTGAKADISGRDDPAFEAAMTEWLGGASDLSALQSLSDLSQAGNAAAQILLASIAARGKLHDHVTGDLPRKERVTLLRMAGGLSGKSWLEAADEPLAVALFQSTQIGEKGAAVAALLELGETQTALLAAQSMVNSGEAAEFLALLLGRETELSQEALVLVAEAIRQVASFEDGKYVRNAQLKPEITNLRPYKIAELAWMAPSPRALVEDADVRAAATDLAAEVRSWTPLYTYCRSHCPDTASACTAVAASLMSIDGPFAMRSPRETLIPDDVYWGSPRITGDIARSLMDVAQHKDSLGQVDACFFDAMTVTQADFGMRP